MLIEAPKPVVPKTEPKPTQTVTAPTKPKQSAEPETITETSETAKRKAAAEQVEKFFAARRARRQAQLDMLNATAINPKPEPSARHHSPHLWRVKHLKRKKIRGKLSEVWAEQTKSSQTLKLVALCHSASCLDSSSIHLTPMTTQLSVPI